MTSPTPEAADRWPAHPGQVRRSFAMTAAALVCLLHAALLLALAGFYGLELLRGEGSSAATVVMSGLLILVFAALLVALARVWWVGSTRAAVPTFVWNGLLVPVVVALYGAGESLLATGLLVALLAGVVTAGAAVAQAGRRR